MKKIDFNNEKTAKSFISLLQNNRDIVSIDFDNNGLGLDVHCQHNHSIHYIYVDDVLVPYSDYPTDPILFEEEYGYPFFEEEEM